MNKSNHDRVTRRVPASGKHLEVGYNRDVEFSEELADQEDWEAIERSERADNRQQGQHDWT